MLDAAHSARPWHAEPAEAALGALGVGPRGLDGPEADDRLARHGPNRLPEARRRNALVRLLLQFHNVLIYVLIAAGLVTAWLEEWLDTGVIFGVVIINAIIGFVQEGKAESALDAIRDMLAPKAVVLRGGRRQTVAGEALVPGDIVLVEAGDRVPADLRLIEVRRLAVQEAVLTGESLAVEKAIDPVAGDAALGDRTCMAFSGTLVAAGQGRGVVVATGAETEIGRISGLISGVQSLETPLTRQMAVFAKWLTVFILLLSAGIFAFGYVVGGQDFTELFKAVVGLAVAAIPEGLPAIMTITLALGVQGMARRRAIVRRLPAIEALGSVSVVCSDKTGTFTRNEMTVTTLATVEGVLAVSGVGYDRAGGFLKDGAAAEPGEIARALVRAAVVNSDATLAGEDRAARVDGDPMEGALVVLAHKAGLDPEAERDAHPRRDTIPFDSTHKFMAVLHERPDAGPALAVKGAPERLLGMCDAEAAPGGDRPIDRDAWREQVEAIAARGQRVLAIAVHRDPPDADALDPAHVEDGLTLLGLVGLIDPPREEAIEAVAECRAAGMTVKMITGDHAGTAAAIAASLGLDNPGEVVTGAELDRLDDAAFAEAASRVNVFARTTPAHKLRLVEALQAQGAVVSMTGDGVNDAPALKRADVGVAMGQKGSEAAKEAAEMVLADDNFATIVEAVRAGRAVYDNLRKAILFILPTNGGQAMVMIAAILLGETLPITAPQILWVNMVTAVSLALAFAFEPPEPGVMRRPPRRSDEPLLSGLLVWRTALVSVLFALGIFGVFEWALLEGHDLAVARTLAVNTLVLMEIFYLFSVRYVRGGVFMTRAALVAVAVVLALQAAFTWVPVMNVLFATAPIGPVELGLACAAGLGMLLIVEVEKLIVGRRRIGG